MAVIAPNSEIYLIKSPLELDNDNQLTFANATAQHTYFNSLPKVSLSNATFQRKDGTIRWPASMESVITYNYCMYRNKSYGNKWFYAFITDIQWLSNDSCAISIKTDVWQTWQFDLTFKKCFVEREHVNDDTFGLHTVPEGLEYGEYVSNGATNLGTSYGYDNCYIIVQVSDLCEAMYEVWGDTQRIYGGLPNGCWFLALYGDTTEHLYQNLLNMVRSYDYENLATSIVSMFVAPKALITVGSVPLSFDTQYGFDCYNVTSTLSATTIGTYSVARQTTVNGYTPVNKKVLCSPYNYLMITNNGGTDISYAWEDFSSATASFTERGIVSQGCDIKLTPSNYKGTDLTGGYEWSVSRQKFPTLSWNSNYYLNWVAVNGKYMEIQAGLTGSKFAASVIGGMLNKDAGSMVNATFGLADNVASMMQQIREAEMTPFASKGNSNTGDLNYSVGKNCFTAYKMSIKAEYAKMIDNYFTQFGYRVNELKVPNITGRTNWNYVRTQGCNVIGDVPQGDIEEIKAMFNRGITIWHNTSTFLDYSQTNSIVI